MLAQAVPDWLEPLSSLGKTGLLGILLALAIWAIIRLYRDLGVERLARVDDAKSVTELVKQSTAATVSYTAAQEDRNRAYESMARALENLQQGRSK